MILETWVTGDLNKGHDGWENKLMLSGTNNENQGNRYFQKTLFKNLTTNLGRKQRKVRNKDLFKGKNWVFLNLNRNIVLRGKWEKRYEELKLPEKRE